MNHQTENIDIEINLSLCLTKNELIILESEESPSSKTMLTCQSCEMSRKTVKTLYLGLGLSVLREESDQLGSAKLV